MKAPLDPTPYPRHKKSRPVSADLNDGGYVYVQDVDGVVWVLEDRPHRHPQVLGGGASAMYAGDFVIEDGRVRDITNLSGTFQCDDADGLLAVADVLENAGLTIEPGAVRLFPMDGGRPRVLR